VVPTFVTKDRARVPTHWTRFAGRRSLLSRHGALKAADPLNATLNYLYALAEAECRLACLMIGLDPGLGFLHTDTNARDSLALDLIEAVRPDVDAYAIDLVRGHMFRYDDFVERDDGHCRILPPLTHALAATIPMWRAAIAPHAEAVAHALAATSHRPIRKSTVLTSADRRRAATRSSASPDTGVAPPARRRPAPKPGPTCQDCGAPVAERDRMYCRRCWPERRAAFAAIGTEASQAQLTAPDDRARRRAQTAAGKAAAKEEAAAARGFDPHDFETVILPALRGVLPTDIAAATGLSVKTAYGIRAGSKVPHPRHWPALAGLAATAGPPVDRYQAGRRTKMRADGTNATTWAEEILPGLIRGGVRAVDVCQATGLSSGSASRILQGRQIPHACHWPALDWLANAVRAVPVSQERSHADDQHQ
jgi:hypothetical protein